MTVRIHHIQQKQANKLGITLVKSDMDVIASKDGQSASAPSAGLAVAALLKKLGTGTDKLMTALRAPAVGTMAEVNKPKAAPKKARKAKAKKAVKFKCESCGCTKRESDGEEGGGFVCAECGEDATLDGDEDGKSVVKRKYKQTYKPHKNTNGDAIAKQVQAEFATKRDPDNKKLKLDWTRFVQFAKINDCWSDTYRSLNHGLARMSVVNRLRTKIKKKEKVTWRG